MSTPTPEHLVSPWYPGVSCEHLYDNCPRRPRVGQFAMRVRFDSIDPLRSDICGICVHRWKRANP